MVLAGHNSLIHNPTHQCNQPQNVKQQDSTKNVHVINLKKRGGSQPTASLHCPKLVRKPNFLHPSLHAQACSVCMMPCFCPLPCISRSVLAFRHLMLYGPPGTGKTLFARTLSRQSGQVLCAAQRCVATALPSTLGE